jgi:hypothetical protein
MLAPISISPQRSRIARHDGETRGAAELSRWGRSTQDLVQTLDDLHTWKVSVLAQTGLSFDLGTASGKLLRTIMAGLAEFERDLIRERVNSGIQAAKARGVVFGRKTGYRPSDKKAKRVLAMHRDGLSYRLIGRNLGLSKTQPRQLTGGATWPGSEMCSDDVVVSGAWFENGDRIALHTERMISIVSATYGEFRACTALPPGQTPGRPRRRAHTG